MNNPDIELIQCVLEGDDTAFSVLVKKYQKSVHALAWRKIGDFHIAEEITQDTFLKAYKSLVKLKKPQSLESWLYVTATNNCRAWLRKKRLQTQPLENTRSSDMEKATYSDYVIQEKERTNAEAQRDVVKKLLAKLQESDRTVITLYYLGGMTYEEISRFLGVSVSAIKNRLYRARQFLKKEENMVKEALENYQITPTLTEKIMQEISRTSPTSPTTSKPIIPLAVVASSALLIVLMLGIGSQFLAHFQKPYSLDAQAEMSVELVNTAFIQNLDVETSERNQVGSLSEPTESENSGQQPEEVSAVSEQENEENTPKTKQQWIKSEPLEGSQVHSMFSTTDDELYVVGGPNPSIFKLTEGGNRWQHLFDIIKLNTGYSGNEPIAKWKNTLFFIPSSELFTSTDDGKTWKLRHSWEHYSSPKEWLLTESAFYIVFMNGIVRSKDEGKTWEDINSGLPLNTPLDSLRSIVEIQNITFLGTRNGLFRLMDNEWEQVDFPESIGRIRSLAATKDKLYAAVELRDELLNSRLVSRGLQRSWWIYRSTDLGKSWTDITPTKAWSVNGWPPHVKLIAAGDTLLVMEKGMIRSSDSGDTWHPVQAHGTTPTMSGDVDVAVVANDNVFYISSAEDGFHQSTDMGKTWNKVNFSRVSRIDSLMTFRPESNTMNSPTFLYARTGESVKITNNQGKTWKPVQEKFSMVNPDREEQPDITHLFKSGDVVYAKGGDSLGHGKIGLFSISTTDGVTLTPIAGMPKFDSGPLYRKWTDLRMQQLQTSAKPEEQQLQEVSSGAIEFFEQMAKWNPRQPDVYMQLAFRTGACAVSGDTFFMEHNYKLFRWQTGQTKWFSVGIEETAELTLEAAFKDLKLAASGETVYVGKRDGHLFVSYDKGNNWIDITSALPFPVKTYNEILFVGSIVYVATDVGVASNNGEFWQNVTDITGADLVMEHLTVDGTVLYGVSTKRRIYQMNNGTWKQIVSKIPDHVTSLAVDDNIIYIGTKENGMLHYNFAKK